MPSVMEPQGANNADRQDIRSGVEEAGRGGRRLGGRDLGSWVRVGATAFASVVVFWWLMTGAVSAVALAVDAQPNQYASLLLTVAAAGLTTAFVAGLRGWTATMPAIGAAVLASLVYLATGGAIDPFLASIAGGLVGTLLGVIVADRRGPTHSPRVEDVTARSRTRATAWTTGALALPVIVVAAIYLDNALDLVGFGTVLTVVALPSLLLGGVCIAQARRNSGLETRWGLSMYLATVTTLLALSIAYIIVTTVQPAPL